MSGDILDDSHRTALPATALRRRCDPAGLPFATTDEVDEEAGLIGQARAMEALHLAADTPFREFNLFVLGPSGSGRHSAVWQALEARAAERSAPSDWVYVNNFDAPHQPRALKLPHGMARPFAAAMDELVDDLASDIPALFESEEYQTERRAIDEAFGAEQEAEMAALAERAKAQDMAILRTPMGFVVAPVRDGHPLDKEGYDKLPEADRAAIDERIPPLQEGLAEILRSMPRREKAHRQRVEALNREIAERVVSTHVADLRARFGEVAALAAHLDRVQSEMIGHAELFLPQDTEVEDGPFPDTVRKPHGAPQFRQYRVNVMVGRAPDAPPHAPVETEDLPSLHRLAGRVEHVSRMGSLMTDFLLIRPGALHRANGGFLVLDARRVLAEPFAWDALKRSLRSGAVAITSMDERLSLVSTVSLEPDPITLDLRVVLVGDRLVHALLVMLDPDFADLFRLQADFEESIVRDDAAVAGLARLIAAFARREGLGPVSAEGVARLIDEAARLAEDSDKLSLHIGRLGDLLKEAAHYARQRPGEPISAEDVAQAVRQRDRRAGRIRDRLLEATMRGTLMIDTEGMRIGQINGLSVLGLGDYRFGRPARISARVRMGAGKLVDIEREVELGGPLHSKGVMILAGYLTATFARDTPFSLHASLVFEQSYGGVDGDSASCAELVALMSALADLPLRQDLAMTGSVNQLGEVQAIGGVNEKVEGFFDLCAERGLTGTQGVLIPHANVTNLMLREDVVAAVEDGRFGVVPVAHVDQALALLTGVPAGQRDSGGAFPKDSVNGRVEARLMAFAAARQAFTRASAGNGGG
jgi:lon-related putative ATP-dependent protease